MLRAVDPFGPTCDPRLYVPRLGTEAALQALREAFATGRRVSVLSGPPGLGKTMVLQVLAAQLAPARCVYVPYVALGIEELAHVALDRLGAGAPGEETHAHGSAGRDARQGGRSEAKDENASASLAAKPGAHGDPSASAAPGDRASIALAAAARRDPTAPLVLLLDDASALPLPTVRALREIVDALHGALHLVAAVVDDARASTVIAAFGDVTHVRLRQPLTPAEAHAYVRGRLARAGRALPRWAREDAQIDALCGEAGGVPRELNTRATLRERDEESAQRRIAATTRPTAPEPARPASTAADPAAPAAWEPRTSVGIDEGPDASASHAPPGGSDATPTTGPPPRRRRRLRRTRGWY